VDDEFLRQEDLRLGGSRARRNDSHNCSAGCSHGHDCDRTNAVGLRDRGASPSGWQRNHIPEDLGGEGGGLQRHAGNVWGIFGHSFVPFTPTTHGASPSDSWHTDKDEAFRFIVLAVKGKTVVLFEESFGLPADQFPAFLTGANRMLASLRFTSLTG
jgi:hypothetical protein